MAGNTQFTTSATSASTPLSSQWLSINHQIPLNWRTPPQALASYGQQRRNIRRHLHLDEPQAIRLTTSRQSVAQTQRSVVLATGGDSVSRLHESQKQACDVAISLELTHRLRCSFNQSAPVLWVAANRTTGHQSELRNLDWLPGGRLFLAVVHRSASLNSDVAHRFLGAMIRKTAYRAR